VSDEDFLQEIVAHPEDDAPRLVYADWLDDNEQPARAEFIRVQVRLAALEKGAPEGDELRRRQAELLGRHVSVWLGPWEGAFPGTTFERGFLTRLELNYSCAPPPLGKLTAALSPYLDHLRELAFEGWRATEGLLEALAPALPKTLAFLNVKWAARPTAVLKALAQFPRLSPVRKLRLSCRMGPVGFRAFLQVPCLEGVTDLDLSHNHLQGVGAVAALLDCSRLQGLKTLRLDPNAIDDTEELRRRFQDRGLQLSS
jgi:uncharacterized protein (TIGR02996 family)